MKFPFTVQKKDSLPFEEYGALIASFTLVNEKKLDRAGSLFNAIKLGLVISA